MTGRPGMTEIANDTDRLVIGGVSHDSRLFIGTAG